jgi:single-stranded-DNA-specific exonuclease
MYEALEAFGFERSQIHPVIPDRLFNGYGLNWDLINAKLQDIEVSGPCPTLVIAVDCGTAFSKEVLKIRVAKLDLIIVDHHEPDKAHPLPIEPGHIFHLNPKLWRQEPHWEPQHKMDKMCAAGLAYLLGWTLLSESKEWENWKKDRALILAGLATCADVMELTGINRVLLKHSLLLANSPDSLDRVPGLASLRAYLGPNPKSGLPVTEGTYGFYWGPCINAPGRMRDAREALNLLMATTKEDADACALICMEANRLRRATQRAMTQQAQLLARAQIFPPDLAAVPSLFPDGIEDEDENEDKYGPAFITLSDPTWHPGVVGIVASQIKARHGRPTIIASAVPDPNNRDGILWTGSGRSVEGCRMGEVFHDAAAAVPKIILKGGGHDMAGGLRFSDDQRPNLSAGLAEVSKWKAGKSAPPVEVITSASLLAPLEWAAILRRLAPFGNGNQCPALIVEVAELQDVRVRTRAQKNRSLAQQQYTRTLGYWAFKGRHIRDVVPFMERLKQGADPISVHVRSLLDLRTVEEMEDYETYDEDAERLSAVLAANLNKILLLPDLYDRERFKKIKLSWQTRTVLKQNPSGQGRVQLNRMLLEDAYPRELQRIKIDKLPSVWGYEGQFEDKLTGVRIDAVWPVIEEAEMLWQVHEFLEPRKPDEGRFVLPYYLRLQLEVCVFVPPREWSNVYRGAHFERDIRFRVRQCIRIPKGPVWKLRMRAAKKTGFGDVSSEPGLPVTPAA